MMKKRYTLVTVLGIVALVLAAAATGGVQKQTAEKGSIAVLFPGLVDDHSWNQAGNTGLKKAKAAGYKTAYIESVTQDQQLEALRNFAQQGYKVVVGHGGEFMDSVLRVAKDFPDTKFVVSNGDKGAKNVTSLALSYGDLGYIAGTIAGKQTKTNKIGMVVGLKIPIVAQAVRGYEAGVKSVNKGAKVTVTVTGSFTDVAKAREASLALINNGVDALWPLLDSADAGVYSAAEDKGIFSMGLYGNSQKLAPKSYVGAPLADPSQLVYKAAVEPKLLDGKPHFLGAKAGVVGLDTFGKKTTPAAKVAARAALKALKSGKARY
jgi:basic membrane protein A